MVVIVNVTMSWPGDAMTEGGTAATDGSLLKRRTVVGVVSGIRVTVPCADAPSQTEEGETESDEIMPSAQAPAGRTSSAAIADSVAITVRRLMGLLQ